MNFILKSSSDDLNAAPHVLVRTVVVQKNGVGKMCKEVLGEYCLNTSESE